MVFDRMVPDGDALDLVAELRESENWVRVLVISALGEGDERVRGLRAGADDYVPKPVRLEELSLRVGSLLVRTPVVSQAGPHIDLGRVVVDRARRRVTIDGDVVHLTPIQYGLVEYLAIHQHRVVPTDELLEHLLGLQPRSAQQPPAPSGQPASHGVRRRGGVRVGPRPGLPGATAG